MVDRNPEKFRRVVIEEKFFPTSPVKSDTKVVGPPAEARALVGQWKGERDRGKLERRQGENHGTVINVYESIDLRQAVREEMSGFSARRILVYPEEWNEHRE